VSSSSPQYNTLPTSIHPFIAYQPPHTLTPIHHRPYPLEYTSSKPPSLIKPLLIPSATKITHPIGNPQTIKTLPVIPLRQTDQTVDRLPITYYPRTCGCPTFLTAAAPTPPPTRPFTRYFTILRSCCYHLPKPSPKRCPRNLCARHQIKHSYTTALLV
jgi:hypothetical protein